MFLNFILLPKCTIAEGVITMEMDRSFVLEMAKLGVIALGIIMVGLIIGLRQGTFSNMFARADVVQMLTVLSIITAATFLALIQVIDGATIAAILSGITGYVLGGLRREQATQVASAPND